MTRSKNIERDLKAFGTYTSGTNSSVHHNFHSIAKTINVFLHFERTLQFCRKFQTLEDDKESIRCRCGMHSLGELLRHHRNSAKNICWGIPRRYAVG